jgi:hypothetical protein
MIMGVERSSETALHRVTFAIIAVTTLSHVYCTCGPADSCALEETFKQQCRAVSFGACCVGG